MCNIKITKLNELSKYQFAWTHTLILKALLNPLAKKPPNGPMRDANVAIEME